MTLRFFSIISNIVFLIVFYFIFLLVKVLTFVFLIIKIKKWCSKKNTSVLFLENFPIENAGYQYRSKKWSEIFIENGYCSKVKVIIKDKQKFERYIQFKIKTFFIIAIIKRFFHILSSLSYNTVVVRRELLLFNDYGNLFMEKFLLSLHKNVIIDFDDDIAFAKKEGREIVFFGKIMLENSNKFSESLKLYQRFIICSDYLKNYIININNIIRTENILIIPTCVQINENVTKKYLNDKDVITFGWIGGSLNQMFLDFIIDDLNKLKEKHNICLLVISGNVYKNNLAKFPIYNIKWSLENQEKDLLNMDIGIMPLINTNESKGKCGFKLLQYMGLGIVSVAEAITINNEIIDDSKNGFLVRGNNWYVTLENVLTKKIEFENIGKKARQRVCKYYSFDANKKKYIEFIKCVG